MLLPSGVVRGTTYGVHFADSIGQKKCRLHNIVDSNTLGTVEVVLKQSTSSRGHDGITMTVYTCLIKTESRHPLAWLLAVAPGSLFRCKKKATTPWGVANDQSQHSTVLQPRFMRYEMWHTLKRIANCGDCNLRLWCSGLQHHGGSASIRDQQNQPWASTICIWFPPLLAPDPAITLHCEKLCRCANLISSIVSRLNASLLDTAPPNGGETPTS